MFCTLNSQGWHKKVNFGLFTAVTENIAPLSDTVWMMSTLFKNTGKKNKQTRGAREEGKKSISSILNLEPGNLQKP